MCLESWTVDVCAVDQAHFEAWLRTPSIQRPLAMRVRIDPERAAGESTRTLGQRLGLTERTVCL
jgi:hypothetical protein